MNGLRKVLIGLVGGFVLLVGVAMMALPGPAFIVIPAGLAILATEFHWARRCKEALRKRFEQARQKYRDNRARRKRELLSAPDQNV